jgi:hypothetical protein
MKVSKGRLTGLEKNTPDLLRVVWLDAMTVDADPYVPGRDNNGYGGCLLSSLGHLVKEDDDFVYISRDSGEFGEARHGCEIQVLSLNHRKRVNVNGN